MDVLNSGGLVLKDDVIADNVEEWLDNHPEATTTVQDCSLTYQKLVRGTIVYKTPQMFGAYADGIHDDREFIQRVFNESPFVYFPKGTYRIVNAYGNGSGIYEQRQNALSNNTLYPLIFSHDNGRIIIDGTLVGESCLGDVIQVDGDDVIIAGSGLVKGNGTVNDYNSGKSGGIPENQWLASLIKLNGNRDKNIRIIFLYPSHYINQMYK